MCSIPVCSDEKPPVLGEVNAPVCTGDAVPGNTADAAVTLWVQTGLTA